MHAIKCSSKSTFYMKSENMFHLHLAHLFFMELLAVETWILTDCVLLHLLADFLSGLVSFKNGYIH